MAHIHTVPGQVDHTVTMFCLRRVNSVPEVMLHTHKTLGRLCPVGGHIELDETPWQAAAHELEEESGYSLGEVRVLQPQLRVRHVTKASLHPQPIVLNTYSVMPGHFHTDIVFGLLVDGKPTKSIAAGESKDLRWYDRDAIVALDKAAISESTREICLYILDNLDAWEPVATREFSLNKE